MVAALRESAHPLLTATIGNRTGFASAFAEGLGVTEATPSIHRPQMSYAPCSNELLEMSG